MFSRIAREVAAARITVAAGRSILVDFLTAEAAELSAWGSLLRAVVDGGGPDAALVTINGAVSGDFEADLVSIGLTLAEAMGVNTKHVDLDVEGVQSLADDGAKLIGELADTQRGLLAELGIAAAEHADAIAGLAKRIGTWTPPLSQGGTTLDTRGVHPANVCARAVALLDEQAAEIVALRALLPHAVVSAREERRETYGDPDVKLPCDEDKPADVDDKRREAAKRAEARAARDDARILACLKVVCPVDGCTGAVDKPCVTIVVDAKGTRHVTVRGPHKERWALAKDAGTLPLSSETGAPADGDAR